MIRSRLFPQKLAAAAAVMMLPVLASAEALVASHRGSVHQAPENTLAAFRWAKDVGADLVEADLRVAQDGSLVVIHDSRVNRTTNGRGKVRKLTLRKLKSLDAGDGHPIPTFEEVLTFIQNSGLRLLLDVKDSKRISAETLVAAMQRKGVQDQVLIGSRSVRFTASLRALAPEQKVLAMVPDADAIQDFLALDVDAVRVWARWVRHDPGIVDAVRQAGAQVWITTGDLQGDSLKQALRIADGVITNHPVEALYLAHSSRAL